VRTYRALLVTALIITCAISLLLISSFSSHAQDLQRKLESIEEDIKRYEERIKREQAKEFSILNELEKVNSQIDEVKKKIRTQRSQLKIIEQKLFNTQNDIKGLESGLQKRKEWLKKKMRALWAFGYVREMEFLLSSRDGGEFFRNWRYLTLLSRYEKGVIDKLRSDIEELRKKEAELALLRKEVKKALSLMETDEMELLKIQKEKSILLATVRQNKEQYKRMLNELNESAKRLAKIIEESRVKGGSSEDRRFLSRRGKLIWPVNGRVKIPFGYHKDPLTGVPVFRSGIYILTEENATVSAVSGGRVAYTGELKGYGKVIIITHGGDYHTVYANLAEIFLKPGDIIIEKQAIGRTGESSIVEGTGLYFEIRYKGKPLDPLQWLSKK